MSCPSLRRAELADLSQSELNMLLAQFLLNPEYFSHMIFNMCDILVQKCQKFSDVRCCDVSVCQDLRISAPAHLGAVTPPHQISHVMSHLAHISSDPCHIKF